MGGFSNFGWTVCFGWLLNEGVGMSDIFCDMARMYKDLLFRKERCHISVFIFLWLTIFFAPICLVSWALGDLCVTYIEDKI
jgi:hypothetical protein